VINTRPSRRSVAAWPSIRGAVMLPVGTKVPGVCATAFRTDIPDPKRTNSGILIMIVCLTRSRTGSAMNESAAKVQ
jgi:hypothetical protein